MSELPPKEVVDDDLLGVVVLATGMVALFGVMFVGLGALIGIVGVLLGAVALTRRKRPKGLAAIGTGLSALSIVLGVAVIAGLYYYFQESEFAELFAMDDFYQDYEDLTYWEGVVAPPLTGELLDGTPFDLADCRGEKVVLYGISYKYDSVDPDGRGSLTQFAAVQEIASDQEGNFITAGVFVGPPDEFDSGFGSIDWGFPMIISESSVQPYSELLMNDEVVLIIDTNGVIQRVFMDDASAADLIAAAAGPDYDGIGANVPPSIETGLELSEAPLEAVLEWQIEAADACGIATGPWYEPGSGDLIIVRDCSHLVRVDGSGAETEMVQLPEVFGSVRLGRYQDSFRVLNAQPYTEPLNVVDDTGNVAWTIDAGKPISVALWLNLDEDANDEVIYVEEDPVQIYAVDEDGKPLWNAGNADYVGGVAGSILPDGNARILVTQFDSIGEYDRRGANFTSHPVPGDWVWRIWGTAATGPSQWSMLVSGEDTLLSLDQSFALRWKAEGLDEYASTDIPSADVDGDGMSECVVPLQRGEVAIVSHDGKERCRVRYEPGSLGMMLLPALNDAPGRLVMLTSAGLTSYALTAAVTQ